MNCLRIAARTGIDCAAHSMRRLPASASERSFTSQGTVVVAVLIFILRLKLLTGYGRGHARFLQRGCFVGCFPGKGVFGAAEVAESGGLAINGTAKLKGIDHAFRGQREI